MHALSPYLLLSGSFVIALVSIIKEYDKNSSLKIKIYDFTKVVFLMFCTVFSGIIQYDNEIKEQNNTQRIFSLEEQAIQSTENFGRKIDTLQNNNSDLIAKSLFSSAEHNMIIDTIRYNPDIGLIGDFCYAILIAEGDGRYSLAVHNPFSFTLHGMHIQTCNYNLIKQMHNQLDENGQNIYSIKDYQKAQLMTLHDIDVKPGVTIYHKNSIHMNEISRNQIAVFEINFVTSNGYNYSQQLACMPSDDRLNILNELKLYKIGNTEDGPRAILVKRSLSPELNFDWDKTFSIPVARVYY